MRCNPNASISVDLPTPGDPVCPCAAPRPCTGRSSSITSRASAWWSARVDSASVMALASSRRSAARTPATSRFASIKQSPPKRRCAPPPPKGASALGRPGGAHPQMRRSRLGGYRTGSANLGQNVRGAHGNCGARTVDAGHARRLSIGSPASARLRRRDDDVAWRPACELGDELRYQRLVPRSQGRNAHDVHVVLHRLPRDLFGRLEQRRRRRRSRGRRTRWRSPSRRGRGRLGRSWRRGCADAALPRAANASTSARSFSHRVLHERAP